MPSLAYFCIVFLPSLLFPTLFPLLYPPLVSYFPYLLAPVFRFPPAGYAKAALPYLQMWTLSLPGFGTCGSVPFKFGFLIFFFEEPPDFTVFRFPPAGYAKAALPYHQTWTLSLPGFGTCGSVPGTCHPSSVVRFLFFPSLWIFHFFGSLPTVTPKSLSHTTRRGR